VAELSRRQPNELIVREIGDCPDRQQDRDFHAAEERPVERAHAEESEGQQVSRESWQVAGEAACSEQDRERREAGEQRRPLHQIEAAKAEPVPGHEQQRIEQAGTAAGVAVALAPLEGVPARGRAREVEMNEDVVEWSGPGAELTPRRHVQRLRIAPVNVVQRLQAQRSIEKTCNEQRHQPCDDRVHERFDP
jgi:hypothetical protein